MEKTLNISINEYTILKQTDIENNLNLGYHMYAILSVNRFYFKNIEMKDNELFFICYNKDYKVEIFMIPNSIPGLENDKEFKIEAEFPCDFIFINNEKIIASDLHAFCDEYVDFEIEYIGISIENNASERLSSHSTLQKINGEENSNHLNKDFYILEFEPRHFETKTLKIDSNLSDEEIGNLFLGNDDSVYFDHDGIIALTEAILINEFKPKYNIIYKNSSSDTKFKKLENMYKHQYQIGVVKINLKKSEFNKIIKLHTSSKEITFNEENAYSNVIKCPFILE